MQRLKRFTVTYRPDTIVKRAGNIELTIEKFKVGENHANTELIEADYYRLDCGHLIFMCLAGRNDDGSYPTKLKIIAPGVWTTVEEELG